MSFVSPTVAASTLAMASKLPQTTGLSSVYFDFNSHAPFLYSRDGIIRLTNHCDKITLFDDGHECLEDVARAIEDEFDDDTLVSLDNRCHGNLCLMMPEDEDDCGDLSDAFVRYTRNKCSSEIRGGYDHHDGYYPNPIRFVEYLDFQLSIHILYCPH